MASGEDIFVLPRIQFWGALAARAAAQAGCKVLFSEDMQQGQKIDGVRVVNPFR